MATTTETIEAFVLQHEACGQLEGTSTPATVEGYRLLLNCSCGAELDSWITPITSNTRPTTIRRVPASTALSCGLPNR